MAYRSLDTDFITLRNVTAYNPDNSFVTPSFIFTASTNGTATWSNQLNISSISTSSITTSSLVANNISTVALQTTTLSTNVINMTNGEITGVSSINGGVYPPIEDVFWKQQGSTGNIYFVNTDKNVGIGNSTPSTMLTVGTPTYSLFSNTINTSTLIVGLGNNPVSSISSIIDGSRDGNYTCGLLVVSNTSSINTGGSIGLGGIAPNASFGTVPYGRITGLYQGDDLQGGLAFETLVYPNANAGLVEHMRITHDGYVGIGTTTPSERLDVCGNIVVHDASSAIFDFSGSDCRITKILLNSTIIQNTAGPLLLGGNQTNDDYALMILNQSNLDISGSVHILSTLSTNIINMTNGEITGLSSINGEAYPPIEDTFWKRQGVTNNIYVDNTINNVGIGNSTPSTLLTVGTPEYPLFADTNNASTLIVGLGNNPVSSISTIINGPGGNYTCGLLVVSNTSSINTGGSIGLGGIAPNASFGTVPYGRITGLYQGDDLKGGLAFETLVYPNANAGLVERMRVTYDGNVGIGTTDPKERLDVCGNIVVHDASSAIFDFSGSDCRITKILLNSTIIQNTAGPLLLGGNQTNNNYALMTLNQDILDISGSVNFNNKYYEYQMIGTSINDSGNDCGWPYGTYIDICGNVVGDPSMSLIISGTDWVCPESGLWQICLNLKDSTQQSGHIVVGNITTKRPICLNKSSASVFISQNDHILTTGNFNGVGDVDGTISMLLLMPTNMSISLPAQSTLICP